MADKKDTIREATSSEFTPITDEALYKIVEYNDRRTTRRYFHSKDLATLSLIVRKWMVDRALHWDCGGYKACRFCRKKRQEEKERTKKAKELGMGAAITSSFATGLVSGLLQNTVPGSGPLVGAAAAAVIGSGTQVRDEKESKEDKKEDDEEDDEIEEQKRAQAWCTRHPHGQGRENCNNPLNFWTKKARMHRAGASDRPFEIYQVRFMVMQPRDMDKDVFPLSGFAMETEAQWNWFKGGQDKRGLFDFIVNASPMLTFAEPIESDSDRDSENESDQE